MRNFFNDLILLTVLVISGCATANTENPPVVDSRKESPKSESVQFSDNEIILTEFDNWLIGLSKLAVNTSSFDGNNVKECRYGTDKSVCIKIGNAAQKKGDNSTAAVFFAKGCLYDDQNACAHLAVMVKTGRVESDKEGENYKRLSELACPMPGNEGCVSLGWYLYGAGAETEAEKLYEASCVAGIGTACYNLAWLNLAEKPEKGEKYLMLSCLMEIPAGCVDSGIRLYNSGKIESGEKSVDLQIKETEEWCEQGDTESCHSLAIWFKTRKDTVKEQEFLQRTETVMKQTNDYSATEKIIKLRKENPELFKGVAQSGTETVPFKAGDVYKGYFYSPLGLSDLMIEITEVTDSGISGNLRYKIKISEGSFNFSGGYNSLMNMAYFEPVENADDPDDLQGFSFGGIIDRKNNEFFGKIDSDGYGAFFTRKSLNGESLMSLHLIDQFEPKDESLFSRTKDMCEQAGADPKNGKIEKQCLEIFGEKE